MPIKVLEDGSGSFEDIANGIRYAADNGADVINMSLGATQGIQALVITGVITTSRTRSTTPSPRALPMIAAAGNDCGPGLQLAGLR